MKQKKKTLFYIHTKYMSNTNNWILYIIIILGDLNFTIYSTCKKKKLVTDGISQIGSQISLMRSHKYNHAYFIFCRLQNSD